MYLPILSGSIASIISTAMLVLTLVIVAYVLLSAFLAYRRGFAKSVLRLATIIASALLSLLMAVLLKDTIGGLFDSMINEAFSGEGFAAMMEASPTLNDLITGLPGALIGPFLFLAFFVFFNIIFLIVFKILKRIPLCGKIINVNLGVVSLDKVLGALVGVICAVLIVSCYFIPFSGYVVLADDALTSIETVTAESGDNDDLKEIHKDFVAPIADNPVFAVSNGILGNVVFETLVSCEVQGDTVNFSDEIAYLTKTYSTMEPLIDVKFDFAKFEKDQGDAFRKFANEFDQSVLVPNILSELLPNAASTWNDGKEFGGIENPAESSPDNMKSLMTHTIEIMETTTKQTLKGDLTTLAEFIATLAEKGTLASMNSSSSRDLLDTLSEPGVISGLVDVLYANDRTQILVADLSNIGFDAIGDSLEIPEHDEEVRAHLTADLNEAIKKAEQLEGYEMQVNDLTVSITNIFAEYGMDTTGDEAKLYAESIIGYGPVTAPEGEKTSADVYFSIIASAMAQVKNESTASGITMLSSSFDEDERTQRVLNIIRKYQANGSLESSEQLANQLCGQTDLVHGVVTLDDIRVDEKEIFFGNDENFHQQTLALEEIIALLAKSIPEGETGAKFDIKTIDTKALSVALHKLAGARTDNEGHTLHNLAGAISNVIVSALQKTGIDAAAANELVVHIIESEPDPSGNKKDTLSAAIAMVDIIQSTDTSSDAMKNNVETLMKDLDPKSAKVLSSCVSPNLISKYSTGNLSTERNDALCHVTKDLLDNFGNAGDTLTDEQLEAEATYMQTIFELANVADNGEAGKLFTTEENSDSKLGKSADQFVSDVKHSIVISETVLDETDALQVAIGDKMHKSDKDALQTAIDSDSELSPELRDALTTAFSLNK